MSTPRLFTVGFGVRTRPGPHGTTIEEEDLGNVQLTPMTPETKEWFMGSSVFDRPYVVGITQAMFDGRFRGMKICRDPGPRERALPQNVYCPRTIASIMQGDMRAAFPDEEIFVWSRTDSPPPKYNVMPKRGAP